MYRDWDERFQNAFLQARPGYPREIFDFIKDHMKDTTKLDDNTFIGSLSDLPKNHDGTMINLAQLQDDVYGILLHKVEADGLRLVRGVKKGYGIEAYRILYKWFNQQTDMAISVRAQWVMDPPPAKSEHDIAGSVLAWEREIDDLMKLDPDYQLADIYRKSALFQDFGW